MICTLINDNRNTDKDSVSVSGINIVPIGDSIVSAK